MANTIAPSIAVRISANAAGFAQTVNNAANSLKVLEQRAKFTNQLLAGFGVGFAAYQIASGITDVVSKLAQFEAEMSKVKAVTHATDEEFNKLRDSALELAGSYGVATKGVAELQTQYARLGFSTSEILDSTKAAIQLSRATGEDLAKSAQIAGSTLRSFNLDASEMNRIADVMAMAFNNTALGLDDFGEAIKYVAPVAANANITLEQTTAMLGVLADAGIKGSQAGTTLRKIISDLGQGAGPILTQKLKEMAAAGLSGAEAMDEVGRTAYAGLLVLSKNTDKLESQTKALYDSKGALDAVSKVVKDNLLGDWEKLNSAIDVTIQNGRGVIPVLRTIVQILTGGASALGGNAPVKTGDNWFLNALGIYPENVQKDAQELSEALKKVKIGFDNVISPYVSPLIVQFGKDLTNLKTTLENQLPVLESERYLKEKLQALQDKALGQTGFVRAATNQEIAGIEAKIKALQDLGHLTGAEGIAASNRLASARSGISVTPSMDSIGGAFKFTPDPKTIQAYQSFARLQEYMSEMTDKATKSIKVQADAMIEVGGMVSNGIYQIADALGQAANAGFGDEEFGKAFLKGLGKFAQQFGGLLIAMGVGEIALKSRSGPAMIAGGIALVAAGGAIKALMKNKPSMENPSGGNSNVAIRGREADTMKVEVVGQVSGSNLIWVMRNGGYNTSKLGG